MLHQNDSHQPYHSFAVGEDADHIRPMADLPVQLFQRVCGVQLPPVLSWETHVGQEVILGVFKHLNGPGELGPQVVDDRSQLAPCRLLIRQCDDC